MSVITVPSKQSKASVAPEDEWILQQANTNKFSKMGKTQSASTAVMRKYSFMWIS